MQSSQVGNATARGLRLLSSSSTKAAAVSAGVDDKAMQRMRPFAPISSKPEVSAARTFLPSDSASRTAIGCASYSLRSTRSAALDSACHLLALARRDTRGRDAVFEAEAAYLSLQLALVGALTDDAKARSRPKWKKSGKGVDDAIMPLVAFKPACRNKKGGTWVGYDDFLRALEPGAIRHDDEAVPRYAHQFREVLGLEL